VTFVRASQTTFYFRAGHFYSISQQSCMCAAKRTFYANFIYNASSRLLRLSF